MLPYTTFFDGCASFFVYFFSLLSSSSLTESSSASIQFVYCSVAYFIRYHYYRRYAILQRVAPFVLGFQYFAIEIDPNLASTFCTIFLAHANANQRCYSCLIFSIKMFRSRLQNNIGKATQTKYTDFASFLLSLNSMSFV